ncbi:YceK/YidQ family lipoprotein [Limnoglobus roseus]|uniref:YceK/YidQ family lipoprotein n=1 Tax=Limnoglobus roseus TaxID=2598579 RepID=A0A5C1AFL3_9BACT|nr:YceK/YidQ family lipoprotein [Limnoglobus roseus]QEL16766.1 YceK/YidQ family lipoprotein [Limnoglobus roseus]
MTNRQVRAALLLSCFSTAGCGTIANVATRGPEHGGMIPFGGVKQDLTFITSDSNLNINQKAPPGTYASRLSIILTTLDLPLSLVGDIVTWPFVELYALSNGIQPSSATHSIRSSAAVQFPADVPVSSVSNMPSVRMPSVPASSTTSQIIPQEAKTQPLPTPVEPLTQNGNPLLPSQ